MPKVINNLPIVPTIFALVILSKEVTFPVAVNVALTGSPIVGKVNNDLTTPESEGTLK
jgi:hypothetical protein